MLATNLKVILGERRIHTSTWCSLETGLGQAKMNPYGIRSTDQRVNYEESAPSKVSLLFTAIPNRAIGRFEEGLEILGVYD